jgi:hypothetical protein
MFDEVKKILRTKLETVRKKNAAVEIEID